MIAKMCASCFFYMPVGMTSIDSTKCYVCGKEVGNCRPMAVWGDQVKNQMLWQRTSGMIGGYDHSEIIDKWNKIITLEYDL